MPREFYNCGASGCSTSSRRILLVIYLLLLVLDEPVIINNPCILASTRPITFMFDTSSTARYTVLGISNLGLGHVAVRKFALLRDIA